MTSPFASNLFITGGAGFLGRGILRYIEKHRIDASVTVYSRDEAKHYALRRRFPHVRTILGDVRDEDRMTAAMTGHDIVLHLGALKYIPEAERDVSEALAVNLDGSRAVIRAAMRAGVDKVCGISTDKAVDPVNVYGMSKSLMERAFQEAQRLTPQTHFVTVRYGNVVSSTGSVVPLFLRQFKEDGMVTITSTEMTRFWQPIDEAVQLIEESISSPRYRGKVVVARCAAMNIIDVARAVHQYAGIYGDFKHRLIGLRPGEKLHEALVGRSEAPYTVLGPTAYFEIPSALSQTGEGPNEVMPYSSDMPHRWMTTSEFIQAIKDADEISQ